jgi:glycerol-3-phosphate acyltransferase PlsY
MEYIISTAIGYLFGSLPSAYIMMKKSKGIDITKEGSGNAGAMNSFKLSNSKLIGISVFLADFLKGTCSTLIPVLLFPGNFIYPALAVLFAVFSHCFNPWIKFKGGRGLATAGGGAIIIFPLLLVVWCMLWVIFYLMRKDILFANISSTFFSLIVIYSISEIAIKYAYPHTENIALLLMVCSAVLIIIFIKHIEPLVNFISEQKTNWKNKK